jgi:TonB family protein
LFLYLLKSTLIVSILYAGYEFFLRKESYFGFNRYYLLFSLISALLLPLFSYPVTQLISYSPALPAILIRDQLAVFTLEEVVIRAGDQVGKMVTAYGTWQLLLIVYFSGVAFQSVRFMFRLIHIAAIVRKSRKQKYGNSTFVFVDGSPTHSFMKWIFTDPELLKSKDISRITEHELVHISQHHTFDLILAELLIIVQWFNPLVYIVRKRIKENHEYLADRAMIEGCSTYESYHALLVRHSGITPTNILTHNFSYSLLKRRLQMMKKPKRPLRFGLGVLFIFVLFTGVFFACSSPGEKDKDAVEVTGAVTDEVLTVAEVMPEFPGGMDSLIKYLAGNIKYPQQAKEENIEGRVFINFVVEKNGSIGEAKVLRGVGGGCDEEALRVVSGMPDWTPGYNNGKPVRVSYNLPVKFTLDINATDSVYTIVDTMPKFPGGLNALMNYLATNIKYPEKAKKDNVHGRVFINFIVEKNGKVSHAKVLRGISKECDQESLRVVSNMPNWKPGLKDGQPVRVSYNLPIKFVVN